MELFPNLRTLDIPRLARLHQDPLFSLALDSSPPLWQLTLSRPAWNVLAAASVTLKSLVIDKSMLYAEVPHDLFDNLSNLTSLRSPFFLGLNPAALPQLKYLTTYLPKTFESEWNTFVETHNYLTSLTLYIMLKSEETVPARMPTTLASLVMSTDIHKNLTNDITRALVCASRATLASLTLGAPVSSTTLSGKRVPSPFAGTARCVDCVSVFD